MNIQNNFKSVSSIRMRYSTCISIKRWIGFGNFTILMIWTYAVVLVQFLILIIIFSLVCIVENVIGSKFWRVKNVKLCKTFDE